jgi:hypothetical protein
MAGISTPFVPFLTLYGVLSVRSLAFQEITEQFVARL